MASNTSLVTQITGQAWIRAADGSLTPLHEGMRIPADADIVTGNSGSTVQLQLDGQPPLIIGENRDMRVSADMAQGDVDPWTSAAPVPADTDTARIIAALDAGDDPFDELDPTAAVLQGGSDDAGGSSFTRLLSVVELTTPLALEYPRPTWPGIEEIRFGGAGSNRAPELTGGASQLLDQLNDDSDVIDGLNVGQYFSDPDGHSLTFSATGLPPGLTINPNTGVISGTLDSSASQGGPNGGGIYSVTVTATDPYGATVSLPFTWTALNPPPVAEDDFATTEENTIVTGNVLTGDPDTGEGQDIDPDGDTLTVVEITNTDGAKVSAGTPVSGINENSEKGGGSFVIHPDGSYSFDPGTDFDYLADGETTTTTVTYKISDGDGGFDTAELIVTVTGTNDAPVIVPVGGEDGAATVTEIKDLDPAENQVTHKKEGVLSFSDPDDSDTHNVTLKDPAPPEYLGAFDFTVNDDNTIDWTFEVDDQAIDHLAKDQKLVQEYVIVVDDGNGGTAEQTVTITIVGTNDAPIIDANESNITGSVTEDDPATATITGTMVWDDDDKTAEGDYADSHTWEVVANKDEHGNPTGQVNGQYGTLTINDDGEWTYVADQDTIQHLGEDITLTDTITVLVNDHQGGTAEKEIVITITGTNDIPVIETEHDDHRSEGRVKESGYQEEGILVTGGQLIASDVDDGDVLMWSFKAQGDDDVLTLKGEYGTITLDATTGVWEYRLDDNAEITEKLNETDKPVETFTAYVSDGKGGVAEQEITVTIEGTNDAPVAAPDVNDVREAGVSRADGTDPNTPFAGTAEAHGNVLDNDTDIDSEHSVLKVDGVSFQKDEDTAVNGIVGADLEGAYGTLVLQANGDYTYTLHNDSEAVQRLQKGQVELEVFHYTVVDEYGAPAIQTLTITVHGTNDQPFITTPENDNTGTVIEQGVGYEQAESAINGTLTADDVDDEAVLEWNLQPKGSQAVEQQDGATVINGQYGWLTLQKDGNWTYRLDNGRPATQALKNGDKPEEIFTARVQDEHGAWAEQDIIVTVQGTNDAPIANDDTVRFNEDLIDEAEGVSADGKSKIGNVLDNDINPDDGSGPTTLQVTTFTIDGTEYVAGTTVTIGAGDGIGSFVLNADGSYVFTPAEHYSGAVPVITYTVQEPDTGGETGLRAEANLTFEINPVADAPRLEGGQTKTDEDITIALGLIAPEVVDNTDLNGDLDGDHPERLGFITLKGIPSGAELLNAEGDVVAKGGGDIKILIVEESGFSTHTQTALESQDSSIVRLTQKEYESLLISPPKDSHKNISITVSVTSYEVDAHGRPLDGVPGESSTETVDVEVLAVTDDVVLKIETGEGGYGDNGVFTIDEDTTLNLKDVLKAEFEDLDGSEIRWITIENTTGSDILVNGQTLKSGATLKIDQGGLSKDEAGFGNIRIGGIKDFSGDLKGVKVTLHAQDTDKDSPDHTPDIKTSEVTLDLHVNPVAGDVTIPDVVGKEDSPIKFLEKAGLTDIDGSETITGFVIKGIPKGWTLTDDKGQEIATLVPMDDVGEFYEYAFDINAIDAGTHQGWTLTPPAHSSEDITLKVEVSTKDVATVNGVEVIHENTTTHDLKVTVKPVAEKIDGKNSGDDDGDLRITEGNDYQGAAPGLEDSWFALSINGDDGFKLGDRWYNADGKPVGDETNEVAADGGTEKTYALLTPELHKGLDGETAAGATFRYQDLSDSRADGDGWVVLTFNGTDPVEIPAEYLNSVEFMAPEHVAGEFKIKVQAKTVDTDPDGNYTDTAISGEAWLEGIVIKPDADPVTLGVQPAQGKEDTDIALVIRPSSADPSETFNVKISGIPAGATIKYGNDTLVADEDGNVLIENFDDETLLFVRPPHNSNGDFKLTVEAQSVDTVNGNTHESGWEKQEILVKVQGVADKADITLKADVSYTEGQLDGHGDQPGKSIALSELIDSVDMHDDDGSETLSFKLTGFPEGFDISGDGVIFMGGEGESREWVFSVDNPESMQDALSKVFVDVPEHYSGKLPGSIAAITTEDDGHSLTNEPQEWDVTITPSPESDLTGVTTIDEDARGKIDFSIADNKGDANEALTAVWIKAEDVDGNENFTLYLGNGDDAMTLAEAAKDTKSGVVLDETDGYYKLTGTALDNVYAQAKGNFAHNTENAPILDFGVKYEVTDKTTDNPDDSSTWVAVVTEESRHEIQITPVTDPVTLELNESGTKDISDRGDFTVDFTVSKQPDDQAAGDEAVSDYDGSERFTQIIVDGVPEGMLLTGASLGAADNQVKVENVVFLGNGQWLISIPDSAAARFTSDIEAQLHFRAGDHLSTDDYPLGITVVTQDTGATDTEIAEQSLQVNATFAGDGEGEPPAVVTVDFNKNPDFKGTEDTPFTLDQAFSAVIDQGDTSFALILELPAGATVTQDGDKLVPARIDGKDVWIITGKGDQGALDDFLESIQITPPGDLNDNTGGLNIDATLTAYLDNGSQSEGNVVDSIPLTPVTDGAVIDITFSAADDDGQPTEDKAQDGRDIAISLDVRDGVDSDSEFGDSVYIQMTEKNGLQGGALVGPDGEPLATVTVQEGNDQGLPPGTYYVAPLPEGETSVDVRYVPAEGQTYQAGDITIDAWVQSKEKDASDWETANSSATGERAAVNNGYDLTVGAKDAETGVWTVTGTENRSGGSDSAITLEIGGGVLFDNDGSEEVVAAQLSGVPVGFLVYVDGKLASNAGGTGNTNNWLIPIGSNGELPEISVLPPQHWSGLLEGLELSVLSGEKGQESWGEGATFNLHVEPKADGIESFAPSRAFNGQDGLVHLNLNIALVDREDASVDGAEDESHETVSLTLKGLGEHALFLIDREVYESVAYDAENDIYTVTGLSQDQVNNLAFVQTGDRVESKVQVEAWTQDGDDTSEKVSGDFDLSIIERSPVAGTDGNDIIVGAKGIDTLLGGGGDDIIYGGSGDNTIIGGKGDDILIGGDGDDVFKWEAGDQGDVNAPATDIVKDFGNGNDSLDLSDLLDIQIDEDGKPLSFDHYLALSDDGQGNTVIDISTSGKVSEGHDQRIILENVALVDLSGEVESQADMIQSLIDSGKLNLDH